VIFFSCY